MDNTKLWPVNQLLDWIDRSNSKFLNLTSSELIVLLSLLKFCDPKWICHPGVSRIANLCGKDKKHVEDILKRLALKKIISIKERYTKEGDRDSNQYKISVDNLWKVGANSPLRWGQIYPDGRGRSTPLTINLTNHVTKKKGASRGLQPKKPKKPQEIRQLAKEWGPGHPDYDRNH
jgi:hypothetical protein